MATPRLSSEYFAARAQSEGRSPARTDTDVRKSKVKIADAQRLPMSRREKGRGGSPELPGADVATRIAGD